MKAVIERLGVWVRVSHISPKTGEIPDFLYEALSTTACAAFIEGNRMKPVESTGLNRKSGYGAPIGWWR
jgi:hypothetical protein